MRTRRLVLVVTTAAVVVGCSGRESVDVTAEAQRLREVIPAFVRGRVARRVEQYAREQGYQVITVEVMRQARKGRGRLSLPTFLK